jgi:hypothetical protein
MPAHDNDFWIALVESNKSRARVYLEFYRAIERRFGQAVAMEICKEAIYNWGRDLAAGLQAHAPDDFEGLARAFAFAPDGGGMFQPRIDRCDKEGLDVQFEACPLKAAWLESGLGEAEGALFCQMASAADHGTLEAAGFAVSIETWQPGRKGCCTLRIRRR